jgi:hypothetical protein
MRSQTPHLLLIIRGGALQYLTEALRFSYVILTKPTIRSGYSDARRRN